MDANQWGWGESLLGVVTGVARREPMITQYEGLLQGALTSELCGMGLRVFRERSEARQSLKTQRFFSIIHNDGVMDF